MGIQYTPPTVINVDGNQQQQQQQQQQGQAQNQGDVYLNDNSDDSITSNPVYNNASHLGGTLNNTQINTSHNTYVQYERGGRIPVQTLNLSGWKSQYDHGIMLTYSIPIGGKNVKLAKRQVEARIQETENDLKLRNLSACANIHAAGFTITDYEALGLGECSYLQAKAQPNVVLEKTQDEMAMLIEANKKQQILIQKLMKRIDEMQTETNNPFSNPG